MKILFVESKKRSEKIDSNELEKLPEKIHLAYTIQYKATAENMKKALESSSHKILAFEQVLGCSKIKPKAPILLVGSGKFHALSIAVSTSSPVFIYDGKITRIEEAEIKRFMEKKKAKITKFLASNAIGLFISEKPGQNHLKEALEMREVLAKKFKNKKCYLFISDNINIAEIENFPIDLFINFACPGLEFDSSKILNYCSLIEFLQIKK